MQERSIFHFKTIRAKILGAFSILIILTSIYTGYTYYNMKVSSEDMKELVDKDLQILLANEALSNSINVRMAAARNYLDQGDTKFKDIFNESKENAKENLSIINKLSESNTEQQEIANKALAWQAEVEEKVFAEYDQGNKELALQHLIAIDSMAEEVREGYGELSDKREESITKNSQTVYDELAFVRTGSLIFSFFIVVISIIMALISSSRISRPIHGVIDRMAHMAKGDISQEPLEVTTKDEVGGLIKSINHLQEMLHSIISSIHHVSEEVASSSEELAQSSEEVKMGTSQIAVTMQEFAQGTESQAINASDLAKVMSEFVNDVQNATVDGEQLQLHSEHVQQLTTTGNNLMNASTEQMNMIDNIIQDAVNKVEELGKHSHEITKLVVVIDEIANQTNLLELNAAIEAARAGEAGKGFSVVASEVRKLAEQVTISVMDISKIVNRIEAETSEVTQSLQLGYEEVKKGTSQIVHTGDAIHTISEEVNQMFENIQGISAGLQDITAKTMNINHAIDEIAAVSEESAAGVEETTATIQETAGMMEEITCSSENLAQIAEELNIQVKQFKVGQSTK